MKKVKLNIAAVFCLLLSVSLGFAQQQIVGQFPTLNGGFENEATGTIPTLSSIANGVQSTVWTKTAATNITATVTGTGGRSGSKYFSWSSTNTSVNGQRANSPTALDASIVGATAHTIQYFYKTTGTPNNTGYAISQDSTANTVTATNTLVNTSGIWTKVTLSITTGAQSAVSPRYGLIQPLRTSANANGVLVDLDDVVLYAGAVDTTAPNSPGTVTATSGLGINVSWAAASGGEDGGGYVVVRYAGASPAATDDPNQNGIYAVGNTIIGAGTGTVRYIGTGTSFLDTVGVVAGTDYYYKVYTVDKAFNYSDESVAGPIQATSSPIFYYKGTGDLADVASWGTNTDGTGTQPTNFTTDGQTFNIRNTTAVSTTALWTVSGLGSKVVLNDNASNPITLTLTAGNDIITPSLSFDIIAPNSGGNTIVYQNSVGISISSNFHVGTNVEYSGTTISTATSKIYATCAVKNNATVTFSSTITCGSVNVDSSSTISQGSASGNYIIIPSGGSAVINGQFRTAKSAGFSSSNVGTADPMFGSLQFIGAENLTLGSASTIAFNRGTAGNTGQQTIDARTNYANLVVSNSGVSSNKFFAGTTASSGDFTLDILGTTSGSGTLTVGGNLNLTNGILIKGGTVSVTSSSPLSVVGGSATAYVNGLLSRSLTAGGSYFFPIGTANGYSPVTIGNLAGSGTITASATQSALVTVSATNKLNRYWTLTNGGGITSADLTFQYLAGDVVGTESTYNTIFRVEAGPTVTPFAATVDSMNHTASVTGITGFSDWTVGEGVPSAASASVRGKLLNSFGQRIANASVSITNANTGLIKTTRSNSFGFFNFQELPTGNNYIIQVFSKKFTFNNYNFTLNEDLTDLILQANQTNLLEKQGKSKKY